MALAVIGAGMGRTGTMSLNLALEALGFGPCHHMSDVIGNDEQKTMWRAAGRGELPDWDKAFAGYRSAVDWPTAHFWREISAHFPAAKVVLTVRDPQAWYDSMSKTVGRMIGEGNDPKSFGVAVVGKGVFGGRFSDRDEALRIFAAHNEAVRDGIPAERLLAYEVSEGWEPLCRFLGVPVPAESFPRSNSTEEFIARAAAR